MKQIALGLIIIPAIPELLMAQWRGTCAYGAPGPVGHYGSGGGITMLLITIAILGVLVFFGMRFLKTGGAADNDPLKILKERYARGEMTKEKYYAMKKDLS